LLPPILQKLRLPIVGAPLFIASGPELVIAQCKAGVVGSFPSLNARPAPLLEDWLKRITEELADDSNAAPYAVNQIVHKTNDRLPYDVEMCVKYQAPIVITSLGAQPWLNDAIHSYGGIVLHDIISVAHAKKALEKGADGLIAVCTGAGGHAGALSPFALIQEIREFHAGPLLLSGAIANGGAVLAAQAMGADLAYVGTAFIATEEANADANYKKMLIDCAAQDIVYSNLFTGVHGNYLKPSIAAAGLDPDNLPESEPSKMNFGSGGNMKYKAWKDIWGCGQGIGVLKQVVPVAAMIDRFEREYIAARTRVSGAPR
jgi:nitronate monooxygenase